MRSEDPSWGMAVGYFAEQLASDCSFSYGNSLNLGEPIASGSGLDGFVVFAPLVVPPEDAKVDVGDDLPVFIVGMYPTYDVERQFIAERGLEAFWQLEWDAYDVSRPPAV